MKVRLQQEKVLLFLPAENIGNLYDSFTKVCTRCHIACQVVPNGCLDQPIENWLSVSLQETEAESPALPGPMLLFCGLSSSKLSKVLETMRQENVPPIRHKAVLTDHNRTWTPRALYEELEKEDRAIREAANRQVAGGKNA